LVLVAGGRLDLDPLPSRRFTLRQLAAAPAVAVLPHRKRPLTIAVERHCRSVERSGLLAHIDVAALFAGTRLVLQQPDIFWCAG
jgi:hypothetical protein